MATAMIRTTSRTGPREEMSIGSSSGSGSMASLLSMISGESMARNVKLISTSFSVDDRLCLQRVAPPSYSIRTTIFWTWFSGDLRLMKKVTKVIFCGIWVRQLASEVFSRLSGFEQGNRKKKSEFITYLLTRLYIVDAGSPCIFMKNLMLGAAALYLIFLSIVRLQRKKFWSH